MVDNNCGADVETQCEGVCGKCPASGVASAIYNG